MLHVHIAYMIYAYIYMHYIYSVCGTRYVYNNDSSRVYASVYVYVHALWNVMLHAHFTFMIGCICYIYDTCRVLMLYVHVIYNDTYRVYMLHVHVIYMIHIGAGRLVVV